MHEHNYCDEPTSSFVIFRCSSIGAFCFARYEVEKSDYPVGCLEKSCSSAGTRKKVQRHEVHDKNGALWWPVECEQFNSISDKNAAPR